MSTDPQLKELAEAIKRDESKHKVAREQWREMQDEGGSDEPEPEDTPDPDEGEEEQIEADADPDDGISEEDLFGDETEPEEEATSDLIDDIREVLAEHDEIDLAFQILRGQMVVDGIAQSVAELDGRERGQVGGDADGADLVGGNAVLFGVVGTQFDGIRGVGVDDDEGAEGVAAGKRLLDETRNQQEDQ